MKKQLFSSFLFIALLFISSNALAQYKFGYLSYNTVFQSMPEYQTAQRSIQELKAKYDLEVKRNEEQFNKMFADFLQGQKDFPLTIMLKRQKELQEGMEKAISFREDIKRLLTQAEKDLQAPIMVKLDSAINIVGLEKGYEYILNTDGKVVPFIHKGCGENITELVKAKLVTIKP